MYMNKKRLLPALLALALLLPALSAAASAVEVETYVNVAVGSPYTATTPYTEPNPNAYVQIDGKELTDARRSTEPSGTPSITVLPRTGITTSPSSLPRRPRKLNGFQFSAAIIRAQVSFSRSRWNFSSVRTKKALSRLAWPRRRATGLMSIMCLTCPSLPR